LFVFVCVFCVCDGGAAWAWEKGVDGKEQIKGKKCEPGRKGKKVYMVRYMGGERGTEKRDERGDRWVVEGQAGRRLFYIDGSRILPRPPSPFRDGSRMVRRRPAHPTLGPLAVGRVDAILILHVGTSQDQRVVLWN
jgi:hypothetical protein